MLWACTPPEQDLAGCRVELAKLTGMVRGLGRAHRPRHDRQRLRLRLQGFQDSKKPAARWAVGTCERALARPRATVRLSAWFRPAHASGATSNPTSVQLSVRPP